MLSFIPNNLFIGIIAIDSTPAKFTDLATGISCWIGKYSSAIYCCVSRKLCLVTSWLVFYFPMEVINARLVSLSGDILSFVGLFSG